MKKSCLIGVRGWLSNVALILFLSTSGSALAGVHYVDVNSTTPRRLTPTGPPPPRTSRTPWMPPWQAMRSWSPMGPTPRSVSPDSLRCELFSFAVPFGGLVHFQCSGEIDQVRVVPEVPDQPLEFIVFGKFGSGNTEQEIYGVGAQLAWRVHCGTFCWNLTSQARHGFSEQLGRLERIATDWHPSGQTEKVTKPRRQ